MAMEFIKNFVVNCGRFIVDMSATIILLAIGIVLIVAFIAGFGGMSGDTNYMFMSWGAIIAVPIALIFFVCCFYFIYIVIDILDTLKNINVNIEENNRLIRNIISNTTDEQIEDSGLMKFVKSTQTH